MSRRGSCAENNFGAFSSRIAAANEPQTVFFWPGDRIRRGPPDCNPRVEDSSVVTLVCEWDYAPATDAQDNGTGTQNAGLPAVVPADTDDMRGMSAQVSIGCGGVTRIRDCDVGRGFRLVVPASTLKVDILYPILVPDQPEQNITQPAVVFTTWIGLGAVPASGAFAPMRKTIHYGQMGPGKEVIFPIPPGALAVIPFASNGTGCGLRQRLGPTVAAGVVSGSLFLTGVGSLQTQAVVLVQGATHVGLVNTSDVTTDVYGVIYLLTL